jgi:hypothetical protein
MENFEKRQTLEETLLEIDNTNFDEEDMSNEDTQNTLKNFGIELQSQRETLERIERKFDSQIGSIKDRLDDVERILKYNDLK